MKDLKNVIRYISKLNKIFSKYDLWFNWSPPNNYYDLSEDDSIKNITYFKIYVGKSYPKWDKDTIGKQFQLEEVIFFGNISSILNGTCITSIIYNNPNEKLTLEEIENDENIQKDIAREIEAYLLHKLINK